MSSPSPLRRPRALVGLLAALTLAGCGGSDTTTAASAPPSAAGTSPASAQAGLNGMLPEKVRAAGVLNIGTEALYPPFESFGPDNKEIVGLDPDLGKALGEALGVKATFTHTAFDGLLPALSAGRFDAVMAAVTDTKARQAKYDFVDYFTTGQAIIVRKGNPAGITSVQDLCGKKVSVLVSSTQEQLLKGFNAKECASQNIEVTALPSDKDALLQVQNGRADAEFTQDAVGRYNASTAGGGNVFELANSEPLLPIPVGMVFNKQDTQLRDAVQAAFKQIISSGAYDQALQAHDLTAGALKTVPINSGTS